jgi:hypothetical protein
MRVSGFSAVFCVIVAVGAARDAIASPLESFAGFAASGEDFSASTMTLSGTRGFQGGRPSLSLAQPSRFAMHQSYSLTAMSTPQGSASSGLYLNTLSYQLTQPLSMFVDVGFYTPIHSSIPGVSGANAASGMGSVVLPRMGLEYKPSERLTMNLELVNGPDAWKAYGGAWPSSAFSSGPSRAAGSRTP